MRMRGSRTGSAGRSSSGRRTHRGIGAFGRVAAARARADATRRRRTAQAMPAHELGAAFVCARAMLEWIARDAGVIGAATACGAPAGPPASGADTAAHRPADES